MKKLFIISQNQFGYHIDTYYYCKYLKDDYDIIYICWDYEFPKIQMANVRVKYVKRSGNIIIRTIRFFLHSLWEIKDKDSIVFTKYFKVVSLLLQIVKPKHCFVLDIRTGSVHKRRIFRRLKDARLKLETRFFRHVTIISKCLAEKLGIAAKAHILPLGADVISYTSKSFKCMNLLYVGTLSNRNIHITIHGFKKFYEEFKNHMPLSYTIIGVGPNNEEQMLRDLITQYGLAKIVKVTGMIPHTQLKAWFDTSNIGISYVPLTDYYECQPVTKTFEYLLAGMPVVATCTSENKKVIDPENGVIIKETANDFYSGLKNIFENRNLFDSATIRNKAINFNWEDIVRKNLYVYLENIKIERRLDA